MQRPRVLCKQVEVEQFFSARNEPFLFFFFFLIYYFWLMMRIMEYMIGRD